MSLQLLTPEDPEAVCEGGLRRYELQQGEAREGRGMAPSVKKKQAGKFSQRFT